MNKKKYCVYLAYNKREILTPEELAADPSIPNYPPDIARLRVYDNPSDQLNAYANTMCPASRMFTADNANEVIRKEAELKANYLDEAWLEQNIYPFI